jgi:hypothetical protein
MHVSRLIRQAISQLRAEAADDEAPVRGALRPARRPER